MGISLFGSSFWPLPIAAVFSLLALVYCRSYIAWRARSQGRPLPPGPKPLPLVGNILDVPRSRQWLAFRDMCIQFGPIIHLQVLNQHIVVLGSTATIHEFLEKRSANTSDRPQTPMFYLTGGDANFASMPYGPWWRRHRRAFWQQFHPGALASYYPAQTATTRKFLTNLLENPSEFEHHIRYTFAAALTKILYDIQVANHGDELIVMVASALEALGETLAYGKYLVEILPFLRHVPSWFPGATVQKKSVQWRALTKRLKDEPFRRVRAAMDAGQAPSCIASELIAKMEHITDPALKDEEEEIAKNVALVAYEGGSDTVFSTLQTAFLAMSLYPEVQRKAQAELDTIVGPHRLPDFSDRGGLVYINAIIKESLRWMNVLPVAVPHCTTEDDELQGYFIPAGSIVIPNVWACMHDPEVYADPDEFRPERFIRDGKLDPTVRDPAAFAFGFGRRVCPGQHFAENALFINLASVLHVFRIGPPVDEAGRAINIVPQMTDSLLSYPQDCRCTFKPRSAEAEDLILDVRNGTAE